MHPQGATRIDYSGPLYVRDEAATLIGAVKSPGRLTTLGELIMPNGMSIWFDGRRSQGPHPIPSGFGGTGINSALTIAGRIQYVRNPPEEVYKVIAANQGLALPFDAGPDLAQTRSESDEDSAAPATAWDSDVPELAVSPSQP